MGRETDRRHLLGKSQCFAQFGRRSAACTLMFPQQSLETKRCENIRERDSSSLYLSSTHTTSLEDLKKNTILLGENQLLFVQNIGLLVCYTNNHTCIIIKKYK